MVQLINGLDFVFLCVAVWLCTIENQSLKHKKKAFKPRKKLHSVSIEPIKAAIVAYNQLLFFVFVFVFVLFYEDDEIISWLPSVKQSTLKGLCYGSPVHFV